MCKTATHDVQTLQKAEGSIKDVSGPVVCSPSKTEHGLSGGKGSGKFIFVDDFDLTSGCDPAHFRAHLD